MQGDPGALLMVEFYGDDPDAVQARLEALAADLAERGLSSTTVTTIEKAQQAQMWRLRTAGLGLLMSGEGRHEAGRLCGGHGRGAGQSWAAFVERFEAIVRENGAKAAYYGHAGEGCLHIRPAVNLKQPEGLATAERIAGQVADLVVEFGGSLSGEHGDGIVRGVFLERVFGAELTQAFRELKQAFDPEGLLNPGKIIDTPPFDDNLRLGPETVNAQPATFLNFDADGGAGGGAGAVQRPGRMPQVRRARCARRSW